MTPQVTAQQVRFRIVSDDHTTKRYQLLDMCQHVGSSKVLDKARMMNCHFQQCRWFAFKRHPFRKQLTSRSLKQGGIKQFGMAEAASHDKECSLAQHARRFHDLSPGIEDDGMSHPAAQQFQTPAAGVLVHEGGAIEVDDVDLDARDRKFFE